MSNAPLELLQTRVQPEWLDYNDHLNDAWYCMLFSRALDRFIDAIGLDAQGRAQTGHTVYTLESHFVYLQEALLDEPLRVTGQLLCRDGKRVHLFMGMTHGDTGTLLSVTEQILLCIDRRGDSRSAPFPPGVAARVEAFSAAHASLPWPVHAGRSVAMRRPAPGQ